MIEAISRPRINTKRWSLTFYGEKSSELRRLWDDDHIPPRVKDAVFRLRHHPTKLFCMSRDVGEALGASDAPLGLYASDLLCELVEAMGASNWPRVLVLVHDAIGPDETDGDTLTSSPLYTINADG